MAAISASYFGKIAFPILILLLELGVGLSVIGLLDEATGLGICPPSIVFIGGSKLIGGFGDAKREGELGIGGIEGIMSG